PLTTSTSGASFLIASTSASSFRSGWYEVSQPIACKPSRPDCSNLSAIKTRIVFQIVCISKPSLSLGSNQVDLGGMISFASETINNSATVVGNSENATAALPSSTRRSSSFVPRSPPMKSIRLSVLTSLMPRIGSSKRSWSTLTSSIATVPVGNVVSGDICKSYHLPSRYILQ